MAAGHECASQLCPEQTLAVARALPPRHPVGVALLPALSVPAGVDIDAERQLGVQLVGDLAEEWTLPRTGKAFPAVTTHHVRQPSLPVTASAAEQCRRACRNR